MNIFHLSKNTKFSARYHCNQHVACMLKEYAQLLSTANRLSGLDEGYRLTHANHPCGIWVRQSLDNWLYLKELANYLNEEYKFRRGQPVNHRSWDVIQELSVPKIANIGLTRPPLAMPDDVKLSGVVASYRNFYVVHKSRFATWTKRKPPDWYMEGLECLKRGMKQKQIG